MARLSHIQRSAFTLIELILSMATATILVGGLAASIFIATQAYDSGDGLVSRELVASTVAAEIAADLNTAQRFTQRTATAVEFTVPDRDGDGDPETLRYAWSSSGESAITKQYNGSAPATLLTGVHSLDFEYFVRDLEGVEEPELFVPAVTLEGFSEQRVSDQNILHFPLPAETLTGDLVFAVAAARGDHVNTFKDAKAEGWYLLAVDSRDEVTLAIWAHPAGAAHTEYLALGTELSAYTFMMTFRGVDPSSPIGSLITDQGSSEKPAVPGVDATSSLGIALRIGAFVGSSIKTDEPGIPKHTPITMDSADGVSGGAAYRTITTEGRHSETHFTLTREQSYVTATLFIPAAEDEQ